MSNNMTEVLDNLASALHSLGLNHAGTRIGDAIREGHE